MARLDVNFYSYSLDHGVDITVTVPSFTPCDKQPGIKPTHKLEAKFPVLYLLHGHGNDHHCWLRYTSVERLAEEQRIALVAFDTGNKAYNNMPAGDNYYDFLNEELPDFIQSMFPISSRREDTYIAGLSMGGYGALAHALSVPSRYCAFGAMSPGVAARDGRVRRETLDPNSVTGIFRRAIEPIHELEARLKEGAELPKGYICCGKQDHLYQRVEDFVTDAKALGANFTWHPVDGFEHEWRYWDMEIANFLQWIPRTDFYSNRPHKV
ncbi:MAG: hypothetical protein IKN04_13980 [Clostridia bacterium]|nr:hypothetical protein [Clostridia bacterium]